jgi:hypothetical protein
MCPDALANADGNSLASEQFFASLLFADLFASQRCERSAADFALVQENS